MTNRLLRALSLTLLGAALAVLVVSFLDARALQAASTSSTPPSLGDLLPLDLGLIAPLAMVLGGLVGVALPLLFSAPDLSLAQAVRALRGNAHSRKHRAASLLLGVLAAFVWTLVMAHVAKRAFSIEASASSIGASLAIAGVVLAITLWLASQELASRSPIDLDPLIALGLAAVLVAGLLAYGISSGTPSGQGGVLAIFGVLKRDELDLRAPGLLLLLATGAALGPSLPSKLFAPLAAALSLIPLVLTLRAGSTLDHSPSLTIAVERAAPLGKIGLRLLRRATDRDHDGFSRTFGGGDCNDRDARIFPSADDVPGNGIDEDCSGADAVPPPVIAPVVAKPPPADVKPNAGGSVILLTVDTLRSDLGFAGNPRPVSPVLDAFAAKSVVFDDAVSLASYTGKSVGPLLAGKYPSETHRGWSHFNTFTKEDIMVAERMRAAGLKTLSVQAHWYFERFSGLGRGFDFLDTSAMPNVGLQQDNDSTTTSDKLTDAAIKRLSDPQITGGKFFCWIHYLDPHADYLHHDGLPDFGHDIRSPYDNEVAFTDQQIGRLLRFIDEQPWGKDVSIVLTSDHGEAFGEHHLLRHGFEVWEELVRVPLLAYVPGATPHHVKVRRSAVDVVPTLLDLASVTPTLGTTPFDFLSGMSLLADISPAPGATESDRDVLVDMPPGPNNDERRAFYHGDKKLYVTGGYGYQLFDLAQDPGEKTDLGESDKPALADMRARYDAFRAGMHEVKVKPLPK